jgi:hypothetical protein
LSGGYTQEQNDSDKADFEANFKSKSNFQVVKKTSDGRPTSVNSKSDSAKLNFFTHDWSDPTTWYTKSIRVVDEVATDSGDHVTYNLAHIKAIDTYHSLVYQEDFLKDIAGFSYRVAVKVNDVAKVEQDPHFGSGGDYVVDYLQGKIVFLSALQANDVVKVTYHYATTSEFVVAPESGKRLSIDFVECQFSDDIVLTDTVIFQPYGFVEVFAPQYCTTNGGPYPPGTKIPLGNPLKYKSMTDFQAEATKSYVQYPAMGGDNWRSSLQKLTIMNWDYLASTIIRSDWGMEIRVSLEHNVPFNGWYATATFYCRSEDLLG